MFGEIKVVKQCPCIESEMVSSVVNYLSKLMFCEETDEISYNNDKSSPDKYGVVWNGNSIAFGKIYGLFCKLLLTIGNIIGFSFSKEPFKYSSTNCTSGQIV